MNDEYLAKLTVEELFQRWPETAVIFQRYQMACVGCVVAPFYTVADAAQVYGLDQEKFLQELLLTIKDNS
ncbi:MAG: DUF1858 domain-containing protein [Anaerolineales bacterium]|nr:DUF1858 domain-containing protein [Anaerolineales bacterium]MCA9930786.1 DUF1858 domain-containing protein [Anaerolineales bacterium]